MNSITELRDSLVTMFNEIKSGSVGVKQAKEMNNTAGKIINSLKVQLEYAELRKEPPKIPFLDTEPQSPKK